MPKHHGRAKGEEEYELRYKPKEKERVRLTDRRQRVLQQLP